MKTKDLPQKDGYETIPTYEVGVGDQIEPINYGLGVRKVEALKEERSVIVLTLDGEPWDTTRGPTNELRLRRYGQHVWRKV